MKRIYLILMLLIFCSITFTSCRDSLQSNLYLSEAKALYDVQEYQKAIECYDNAINLNVVLDKAYSGKADCLEMLGKYDDSLKFADKAINLNDKMHEAYNIKGNVFLGLGKYEDALENYKKAAELSSSNSMYQNNIACTMNYLEKYDDAIKYCTRALELNSRNDMAYVNKGYALQSLGKINESIECFDKAIELNSNNSLAYSNKGYSLENLGKYQEAISHYDKSLKINPNDTDVFNSKSSALISLGKYADAIASADEALKKDPQNVFSLISKAISQYEMQKYTDSIESCDKALQINPKLIDAYCWKAKNYILMDDVDKAKELCDKAITINGKDPFPYDVKGLSYIYESKYNEAISIFTRAIELDSKYEDSYLHKIYSLYNLKDYLSCIKFSEEAFTLFPSNEQIPWYIAECYAAQSKFEKAIDYYKKVIDIVPDINAFASIAWLYYYLQDYEKAEQYLEKLISLDPNDENISELKEVLKEQKLPEAQRVVNFVEKNYLYLDKVKDFKTISNKLVNKSTLTGNDISQYIDSIKLKDDIFTFVLSGKDYELMKLEESQTQVVSKELNPNIYYIKINTFTSSVSMDFKQIINSISVPQNKVLVIDLRNNTGGLTSSSNDILDFLLPECTTSYIVYRDGYIHSYQSNPAQIKFKKIIVLVNEYSASSSELMALGLRQFLQNVVIIGHPTFGKGVGQIVYEDKSKKYAIFLVSFYWNVKEKNILNKKIQPDIYIKGSSDSSYLDEVYQEAQRP